MEGTVTAVARSFFDIDVGLELQSPFPSSLDGSGMGTHSGANDELVYLLTFPRQQERGSCFLDARERLSAQASACTYVPSSDLFYRMFPFHFILDSRCHLIQVRSKVWDFEL